MSTKLKFKDFSGWYTSKFKTVISEDSVPRRGEHLCLSIARACLSWTWENRDPRAAADAPRWDSDKYKTWSGMVLGSPCCDLCSSASDPTELVIRVTELPSRTFTSNTRCWLPTLCAGAFCFLGTSVIEYLPIPLLRQKWRVEQFKPNSVKESTCYIIFILNPD